MFAAQRSLFFVALALLGLQSAFAQGNLSRKYCKMAHIINNERVRRISNGTASLPNEFPHMAALGYDEENEIKWLCGGTLINSKFILTAASCITKKIPKYVKLGDLKLNAAEGKTVEVDSVIPHFSYTPMKLQYDIGLVKLKQEIEFNDFISPACLNAERTNNFNHSFIATGFGFTSYIGGPSGRLLKTSLQEVSNEECNKFYEKSKRIDRGIASHYQTCAVGDYQDSCKGIFGGPLQILNPKYNSIYDIFGITSYSECGMNVPGIYTRVSAFIYWIEFEAFFDYKYLNEIADSFFY